MSLCLMSSGRFLPGVLEREHRIILGFDLDRELELRVDRAQQNGARANTLSRTT